MTAAMTCGVTRGWSPRVTSTQSQSPTASTPQRSEAAMPSCQSAHSTARASPKSTASRTRGRLGAEHDDDRIDRRHGEHRVDRVLQERATPSSSASCLGEPKRDAPPAASTTPPIKR